MHIVEFSGSIVFGRDSTSALGTQHNCEKESRRKERLIRHWRTGTGALNFVSERQQPQQQKQTIQPHFRVDGVGVVVAVVANPPPGIGPPRHMFDLALFSLVERLFGYNQTHATRSQRRAGNQRFKIGFLQRPWFAPPWLICGLQPLTKHLQHRPVRSLLILFSVPAFPAVTVLLRAASNETHRWRRLVPFTSEWRRLVTFSFSGTFRTNCFRAGERKR